MDTKQDMAGIVERLKLSPLMMETLEWIERGGCIGCPGTRSTIIGLRNRGLITPQPRVPSDIHLTSLGIAALRARAHKE